MGTDGRTLRASTSARPTRNPRVPRRRHARRTRVDIVAELPGRVELPDGTVGVIRAVDFFEHVADKVALINELYRLLAPGGVVLAQTPSTDGRGAFQDPTHVAFYNENSFWYYTDENYSRYVPEIEARFQVSRLHTHFPSGLAPAVGHLVRGGEPHRTQTGHAAQRRTAQVPGVPLTRPCP